MQFRKQKQSPVKKELDKIEREEKKLLQNAMKPKTASGWKLKLEGKIPTKTLAGLKKAFAKGFSVIFEKGSILIEKTYDRDSIEKDFQINDYAMDIKGGRKEIGRIQSGVSKNNILNTAVTTVEGVGLGALGIGLPDIVIWVGVLLRGVYETALKYGFDYASSEEKLFILKMIETAMLSGEDWIVANAEVNQFILQAAHAVPGNDEMKEQIEKTADAFATEMLVTKFIQGLPVVGMLGGAANPVYYRRIMRYVQLKYRKRYLMGK